MILDPSLSADLADCASEPIHIPGAIQPHGFLAVCGLPDWDITHVTANLRDFLPGRDVAALLGQPLEALTGAQLLHDLRNAMQNAMAIKGAERLFDVRLQGEPGSFDASIHAVGERAVVEFLPHDPHEGGGNPMTVARGMIARLDRATTLQRYCQLAASQLRAVTGFDRVMIYKFLPDESGQVIAEAVRGGMEPYLGLRYPASDIPPQARAMFLKQWLRAIPDATYAPVPLLPQQSDEAPVDLGLAQLRSVSPIHLEYLANMGVAASLTISIVVRGRLWGLMACHHSAPRLPSASICSTVELFAQIFSLQVESKQREDEQAYLDRARLAHHRLINGMSRHKPIAEALAEQGPVLMEAIPSDGVGIWVGGRFAGFGSLPPQGSIAGLIGFVDTMGNGKPFVTDNLSADYPPAAQFVAQVSGVLAVPISRSPADYLLFFRRELVQTVTWGGDPRKAATREDGQQRISPRKSFAAWRETVRHQSLPWHEDELAIADSLRVALLELILLRADVEERERRDANQRQALLIAELNHRVKNILALIGSLMRQSIGTARSVEDFTTDLEARIRTLAVAHEQLTGSGWSKAPLRALVAAEFEPWLGADREGRVDFAGPDIMLETRAYQALALVVHELVTNAAKHGALSRERGRVVLHWRVDEGGALHILWRELGGPRVSPPTRRGFGSTIIERAVPFELQGEALVRHLPEGLCADFIVPAEFVFEGEAPPAEVPTVAGPLYHLSGAKLLLVEDSMMIALDAEAMLREAGAGSVEVAASVRDAMRVLTLNEIDAAILDLNLHTETSHAVGDYLMERQIPFAFATGYGDGLSIPERFGGVPVIAKPYDRIALQAVLGELLRQRALS